MVSCANGHTYVFPWGYQGSKDYNFLETCARGWGGLPEDASGHVVHDALRDKEDIGHKTRSE